jgi:hypothetical protein
VSGKASFPTFFHISEYGTTAYEQLHAMVATSSPLNLWAPSSVLLRESNGRISPKDFIYYVEHHHIRILAREEWLTSPDFRNNHKWSGAAWDTKLDGALLSMCKEDSPLPDDSPLKRVIVAAPEAGWQHADEYLQANPDQVRPWARILRSKTASDKLPPGTLETAQRHIAEAGAVEAGVRSVIRDVWNHGAAYQLSHAKVPFNRPDHDRFMKLLATVKGADPAAPTPPSHREQKLIDRDLAVATEELFEALGYLSEPGGFDLKKFLKHDGHESLVGWFDSYCDEIKRTKPQTVDGEVVRKLATLISSGEFEAGLKAIRKHPILSGVNGSGLAIGIISTIVDPTSVLGILGLGASVFALGAGFSQLIGLVPPNYTGTQWPYLFTYGKAATQRRQQAVAKLLQSGS